MLATPVDVATVQGPWATAPTCCPHHRECRPTRFAAEPVERIVLAVVVSPAWGSSEEASPSPVDGARLLSGLRVIPSRGFKSRRLRSWGSPVCRKRRPGELRHFTGGATPGPRPEGLRPPDPPDPLPGRILWGPPPAPGSRSWAGSLGLVVGWVCWLVGLCFCDLLDRSRGHWFRGNDQVLYA